METVYRHAFNGARLYPAYDASMFKWKLDVLGRSSRHRAFAGVVRDGRDPIGFYVWLLECDGRGTVIDMLAARRHHEAVMGHVLAHAHENGAESIAGSCGDAHEVIAAQKAGASLSYSPSTYVVHSRNEDVLRCFLDNPPYLSAFDGDAWLDFPRV